MRIHWCRCICKYANLAKMLCKMFYTLGLVAAMLSSISAISHDIGRSNFLLVIVDDLRPALGCYGDRRAHTPNIDRLASEGIRFEKAYAQQALCGPSRNSLLTSRRPDTLGLYDFYSYWREVAGNYTTLPEHLRNNGYTTVSLGKVFHPGASSNYSDDSPYSWSRTPFHPRTDRFKDAPVCSGQRSPPARNLICPVRVSSMPTRTLPDIEILNAAKQFLNSNREEPFFLAVGFQKPHIPLKYPKRYMRFHSLRKFVLPDKYEWPINVSHVAYNSWMDLRRRNDVKKLKLRCPWQKIPKKYARKIIRAYYSAVTYIDDLIGQLMNELEMLKIRKNTVIILTSDHGWSLGEHAEWAKYSNFEVALRVPLIISIPNLTFKSYDTRNLCLVSKAIRSQNCRTKASVDECCDDCKMIANPVELLDVFPTIAELAGFPVRSCPRKKSDSIPNLCTEGSSLIPLIEGLLRCQSSSWKNAALSQYPRSTTHPTCTASDDEPRLRDITIMGYTLRTIRYRYTAWVGFSAISKRPDWQEILAEELYDHSVDADENFNIANLDASHRVKSDLKNLLIFQLNNE
ncbi:PREDICTED: iduronate 2-sulfatase isoform X2 [Ceratosolen solmsi marchali]|uniref:Iduronate 2-sulfatase isoform X2 n=1 Tax=Ceratosolen solmsi marchali TaxID=326594 RepID=A0AAJ7DZG6_9HYME|nr:PREDICTED: iduronate 2-sulfatase isoform X2 [Ceratosolen solmsi marchali]